MTTFEHWRATWNALGVPGDETLYRTLIERYSEPQRYYHTLQHLAECFEHFAELRAEAERPAEIEYALWFHDAIYNVRRQDNEARSADLAHECAIGAGLDRGVAERARSMILATAHSDLPDDPDTRLLIDVDLWILAAPPERFAEYETQIRDEYAWVPGFLFRRKRKKILQAIADRPRIYSTALFFERYEERARTNLRSVL